jgi:hypothetical protein
MRTIHTYLLSNTMIMMISLYSQSKENVTSFETLKLFTQYILHQHIYSISPSADVSMDFCAMPIYIYIYIFVSREMKKKKKIHGRSSLHTKLIRFEVSVCYIQRSICDGRKKKQGEAYFSINSSSYPIHMYYFSYVSV